MVSEEGHSNVAVSNRILQFCLHIYSPQFTRFIPHFIDGARITQKPQRREALAEQHITYRTGLVLCQPSPACCTLFRLRCTSVWDNQRFVCNHTRSMTVVQTTEECANSQALYRVSVRMKASSKRQQKNKQTPHSKYVISNITKM